MINRQVKSLPSVVEFRPSILSILVYNELNFFIVIFYVASAGYFEIFSINSLLILFLLLFISSFIFRVASTTVIIQGPILFSKRIFSTKQELKLTDQFALEARRRGEPGKDGDIPFLTTYSNLDFYTSNLDSKHIHKNIYLGFSWTKRDIYKLFSYIKANCPNVKEIYYPK